MAGRGPVPKATSGRRGRLQAIRRPDGLEVPELPEGHDWHDRTLAWWADLWASPMAGQYDPSDVHGLYILAALVDQFWTKPSRDLAAEIRLQRQCYGLTPTDRLRLRWDITTEPERPPLRSVSTTKPERDPRERFQDDSA